MFDDSVFMRGKYRLDEIVDGKDELKLKQGQKTILASKAKISAGWSNKFQLIF